MKMQKSLGFFVSTPKNMDAISITEAAKILGVRQPTLNKWIREGAITLPQRMPNGHQFYKFNDLTKLGQEVRILKKVRRNYFKKEK
jgi:excisionase family DNA binding protein